MLTERELQISPIVQESVVHNTKVRPAPESSNLTTRSISHSTIPVLSFKIIATAPQILTAHQ